MPDIRGSVVDMKINMTVYYHIRSLFILSFTEVLPVEFMSNINEIRCIVLPNKNIPLRMLDYRLS